MENFELNSRNLSAVLCEIISQEAEQECFSEGLFRITPKLEEEGGEVFNISFVPRGTRHPLQNLVGKAENGFFLVGKALVEVFQEEDGEEVFHYVQSKLSARKTERVLVGTPVSQEVRYIDGSEPLHRAATKTASNRAENTSLEYHIANLSAIHPVSCDQGRYVTSLFDFAIANDRNLSPKLKGAPLWVLTETESGSKATSLSHLASLPKAKTINHVVVNNKGPFANLDALPKMSYFKKWHLGHTQVNVSTCGYVTYELLGLPQMVSDFQDQEQSSVFVEFAWEGVDEVMQLPPLTCNSVLHVQSIPGSMERTAQQLNQEMSTLCVFSELLEDMEQPWPFEFENEETAVQKIEQLLDKINSEEGVSTPGPEKEGEESQIIEQDVFMTRKDLDFTESLWMVLKDSHGFTDLLTSFQLALSAILSGSCQPMLFSTNNSTIAVLLRKALTSETADEKQKVRIEMKEIFNPQDALRCLVEIGAEKIMHDLSNYFLSEELVTQEQLDYYTNTTGELSERVQRVRKLHNVLDLVLTTRSVIDIGHSNLQLLTQSALAYYEKHKAEEHPMFSLSLPAFGTSSSLAVKSILMHQKPSIWCVSLKSKCKKEDLVSVVQFSTMSVTGKLADLLAGEMSMVNGEGDVTLQGLSRNQVPYYLTYAKQTVVPMVPSHIGNNRG